MDKTTIVLPRGRFVVLVLTSKQDGLEHIRAKQDLVEAPRIGIDGPHARTVRTARTPTDHVDGSIGFISADVTLRRCSGRVVGLPKEHGSASQPEQLKRGVRAR